MIPVIDERPCDCACHSGRHLYHVVWKPCCDKPVQGGKEKLVFKVPIDNPEYFLIASSQEEANQLYIDLKNE